MAQWLFDWMASLARKANYDICCDPVVLIQPLCADRRGPNAARCLQSSLPNLGWLSIRRFVQPVVVGRCLAVGRCCSLIGIFGGRRDRSGSCDAGCDRLFHEAAHVGVGWFDIDS